MTSFKIPHIQPIIVQVEPGCGGHPIWLACFPSDLLPGSITIIVSNYNSSGYAPSHFLHIPCTEAAINRVADLYDLHETTDGESSCEAFAKNRESFCVNGERCPLRLLTTEKLFIPLIAYQLDPRNVALDSHREHQ